MSTPITVVSADAGKLLLRLALGLLLLMHGLAKVASGPGDIVGLVERTGLPGSFGYAVYIGEVLAPLALILGVWTRIAALVIAISMAAAVALVHMGELLSRNEGGGWALELQGMFFFAALAIALIGSGRYAMMRS